MNLQSLLSRLEPMETSATRAFVGFDGYVDRIQKVVRSKSATGSQYFDGIREVADLMQTMAGKSGQIELITLATKIGGNAPILANALASLGVPNWCVGPLDEPIFAQMHPACDLISVGPPASTNALEFGDGKIMLSEVSPFERLRWAYVAEQVGLERLRQQYVESQLLAFVDWANLPHGNNLWAGYLADIVQTTPRAEPPFFLFDLCDPTKRGADEIRECLAIVAAFVPYGRVVLGMNENEARRIYLALNGYSPADTLRLDQTPGLATIATYIQHHTAIPTVLIHPTNSSLVATAAGIDQQNGRLVPIPKVLTGAGDNLNAGFCWGLLHGFDMSSCLLLGMAASGAYIQNGYSPSVSDLTAYLTNWKHELMVN